MNRRILQIVSGALLLGVIVFVATREPAKPSYPRWEKQGELLEKSAAKIAEVKKDQADVALVKGLLRENLSKREFGFPMVVEAVSGKKVLPLAGRKSGERMRASIGKVLGDVISEMNKEDSPIRGLRRINEGSRFFEDGLRAGLDALDGISCEIPHTRAGEAQRSGYPDLKITDEATGEIYYLDPKLMEHGSVESSLRTFYFEPKDETLKITDDATHLLVGIEHDGNDGQWKFSGRRLVDLSGLKVKLKAEFQASNRELYVETSELEMPEGEGRDSGR